MEDLKIYTLDEVSKILKLTKRTLYTYLKAGDLKAVKIGKYWRVPQENLKDFIEKCAEKRDQNRRFDK